MAFVFAIFAIGLGIAAYKSKDRATRIFLAFWCVANLAGVVKAVVTDDPYAFKLRPNDGEIEPAYRRP